MERIMKIDVSSQIKVRRPRAEVSAYAANPATAREWMANVKSMEWKPPLAVHSQIGVVSELLGRRLKFTCEIIAFAPEEHLVMRTAHPFPMEMSYVWESTAEGGTRMTIRSRGAPTGFSFLLVPMITAELRRSNEKSLCRLKKRLEDQPSRPGASSRYQCRDDVGALTLRTSGSY
jgi:hypothetical protein